jgi:hypothetical protein
MNHYYTDPLKAAWMMREHGLKFLVRNPDMKVVFPTNPEFIDIQDWTWLFWVEGQDTPEIDYSPMFIHPESLPLLEPMEGDMVHHPSGRIGYVQDVDGEDVSIDVNGGDWGCKSIYAPIIQRNGKAFFMPESEGK